MTKYKDRGVIFCDTTKELTMHLSKNVTLIIFTLRNALGVNLLLGLFKEIYLLKSQRNFIIFTIIKLSKPSGSVFLSVKGSTFSDQVQRLVLEKAC